ncbi:hypothetical protein CXG81DRAFT_23580 [Caulochytrium protostelioides]|uniref:Uncharacterized protein n=1 Tax=Caulochytrium protostelioides TaxID=1555241 RepID=A0A4P9XDZ8_9FUNG|nr:hypothetical protein CXG81DRAFT_23580 [Caulochytrium protostelioides]|eukprot:RKP03745.1 hypothetical protein CXG81DRAFT_23580 [Caulochytrium protostelioides]
MQSGARLATEATNLRQNSGVFHHIDTDRCRQIQEETAHAVYDYILEELVEIRDMLLAGVERMQRAQKTREHVDTFRALSLNTPNLE